MRKRPAPSRSRDPVTPVPAPPPVRSASAGAVKHRGAGPQEQPVSGTVIVTAATLRGEEKRPDQHLGDLRHGHDRSHTMSLQEPETGGPRPLLKHACEKVKRGPPSHKHQHDTQTDDTCSRRGRAPAGTEGTF